MHAFNTIPPFTPTNQENYHQVATQRDPDQKDQNLQRKKRHRGHTLSQTQSDFDQMFQDRHVKPEEIFEDKEGETSKQESQGQPQQFDTNQSLEEIDDEYKESEYYSPLAKGRNGAVSISN